MHTCNTVAACSHTKILLRLDLSTKNQHDLHFYKKKIGESTKLCDRATVWLVLSQIGQCFAGSDMVF